MADGTFYGIGLDNASLKKNAQDSVAEFKKIDKAADQTGAHIGKLQQAFKSGLNFDGGGISELKQSIQQSKKYLQELKIQYKDTLADIQRAGGAGANSALDAQLKQVKEDIDLEEAALKGLETRMQQMTAGASSSFRTEMMRISNTMKQMRLDGEEETEMYHELEERLRQLTEVQKQFAQEQKNMAMGAGGVFSGMLSGMQGLMGAYSVASGLVGRFTKDQEKLQEVQTKMQSSMAILIGLQQVANTLHSTSAFRITIVSRATQLWHGWNLKTATSLIRMGVAANTARVATIALHGALLGLGGAAVIGAIALLTRKSKEAEEQQKRLEEAAAKTQERFDDYKRTVGGAIGNVVGKYKTLQADYKKMASEAEKVEWVKKNKRAVQELGFAMDGTNDADRIFIEQTDLVIAALKARAEATALQTLYQKEYTKQAEAQIEAMNMVKNAGDKVNSVLSGNNGWQKDWQKAGLGAGDVKSTTTTFSGNWGTSSQTIYELTPEGERKMREYYEGLAQSAGAELVSEAGKNIEAIEGMWDEAIRNAEAAEAAVQKAGVRSFVNGDNDETEEWLRTREQIQRDYINLVKKNQDSEIALIEDGSEKKRRQAELDYEREKASLEATRATWAANNMLTEERNKAIDEALEWAKKKHDKTLSEIADNDEKHMAEIAEKERERFTAFLKEYGSFQDKRLALSKDYAARIKKAQQEGSAMEVAQLQQQFKQAVADIDAEELMSKVDLSMVFSDLGLVLVGPLQKTIDELREFTKSDKFKSLDLDQQKALFESIAKAEKQLGGLSGLDFSSLGAAMHDYNMALGLQTQKQIDLAIAAENLAKAEEELEAATKSGNQAAQDAAKTRRDAALAEYTTSLDDYNAASSKVIATQSAATTALQKFNSAVSSLENGIKKLMNGQLSGLVDMLGPQFSQKLGMIISGGQALKNEANAFIETLAARGKDLQDFAKEASKSFTKLFDSFSGTAEEAVTKANEWISQAFGEGIGKDLQKDISKQVGDLLSNALKDGVIDEDALKELGDGVGSLISKLGEAGESSGNIWGIIIGLVLTLLDEFKENGIGDLVEELLVGVADAVEGILENLLEDIFTHLINGIGALLKGVLNGVVKLIANIFTLGTMSDEIAHMGEHGIWDEEIDKLVKSNESLQKAINELKETIRDKESTNEDAEKAYERNKKMYQENLANTRKLMKETAAAWSNGFLGIGGSHSSKHHINTEVSRSSWDAISNVVGRSVRDADAFFNLTAEEMKKVSLYATSAYAEVLAAADAGYKGAAQYIEQYVELAGQLEEIEFALYEKLTGVSWDSFYDDFKSLLKDMDSDAEAFADQFSEYMSDAILENLANEKYRDRLKDLYRQFAYAMSSDSAGGATLTEAEIAALKAERERIVNEALAERERLIEAGLIDAKNAEEERKGATKSAFGASQESVEESNARLTTIQVHTFEMNETTKAIRTMHSVMLGFVNSIMTHIIGIHKDTTDIKEKVDEMASDVKTIRTDTGGIVKNGVTLKR